MSRQTLISVAVAGPLRRAFVYEVPDAIGRPARGQRVLAPFGPKRAVGFCLGEVSTAPANVEIKQIIKVLDQETLIPSDLFTFCVWMADYYFANPADCLACALPTALRASFSPRYRWIAGCEVPENIRQAYKPGALVSAAALRLVRSSGRDALRKLIRSGVIEECWDERASSDARHIAGFRLAEGADLSRLVRTGKVPPPLFDGVQGRAGLKLLGWSDHLLKKARVLNLIEPIQAPMGSPLDFIKPRADVCNIALTSEQQHVVSQLVASLGGGFTQFLLHGITGSGKTIVYCHVVRATLEREETALVLTPEIALSGATLAYFRGFFGDRVTVIHSAMTERERLESWQGIRQGKYQIVVGPRSAIFAPLPRMGLIIVDEEHDGSYKQDDPAPRFHGRDAAIMRAKINGIPVVLGSASPSIESYHHARSGRYRLLELAQRPKDAVLPEVRVIDMRTEGARGEVPFISISLKREVEKRLALNQQVILFLNRRGHSPMLRCGECGYIPHCPHCDIRLTYHRVGTRLTCHYCGLARTRYDRCDACAGTRILYLGAGTQKVEEVLPRLFSQAQVVRLDSDSASGRASAHLILGAFAAGDYNLLLGTQMVTKGLDMPNVSLVGVLSADTGADLPDFRASEKTFARLLQVAGRSGRATVKGEVLFQTFAPDSDLISDAARQDYRAFFEREIRSRKEGEYPPFVRLTNFILSATQEGSLEAASLAFHERLLERLKREAISAKVLGPAPCPLYLLRKSYRRHLIVKTMRQVALVRMLTKWETEEPRFGLPATIKISVDVDPDDMM